ncbi:unnamed protein product, partial [Rotaria magnacalcarata]
ARRTFICEPLKIDNDDDKQRIKNILTEMNATMNAVENEKHFHALILMIFLISIIGHLTTKCALRVVHTRTIMIHKREPNTGWVNQYNEEILRAWNANMIIQFILDPYACAK